MVRGVTLISFFAVATLVLWVIGALFSDRWVWSQWLLWIPTLFVIFVFTVMGVLFFLVNKKTLSVIYLGGVFALAIWFCFFENHLFSGVGDKGTITLVGWTMSHPKERVAKESAELIVELNGDIILLTHGWRVRAEPSIQEWVETSGHKVTNSQFTLLTKFAPIQAQTLLAVDEIYISAFVLDTTEILGNVLVVWAVDLPSSLDISKMEIANRVLRLLKSVDTLKPDIVIGDFNMTRNSAAILTMFPKLYDAADTAGNGILASFPLQFPIYHIDHILLTSQLCATNYSLINPHVGRHRIQVLDFGLPPEM
tara:strand:+ start:584 stop:1513 length:930 start_codon:yes stop_codon:yes gene_type:complete